MKEIADALVSVTGPLSIIMLCLMCWGIPILGFLFLAAAIWSSPPPKDSEEKDEKQSLATSQQLPRTSDRGKE